MRDGLVGACGLLNSLCVALVLMQCTYVHGRRCNKLVFELHVFTQFLTHGAHAGVIYVVYMHVHHQGSNSYNYAYRIYSCS